MGRGRFGCTDQGISCFLLDNVIYKKGASNDFRLYQCNIGSLFDNGFALPDVSLCYLGRVY